MSEKSERLYLGDGLYAAYDGWIIELSVDRDNGRHWVCLEPEVFEALMRFVMKVQFGLKRKDGK